MAPRVKASSFLPTHPGTDIYTLPFGWEGQKLTPLRGQAAKSSRLSRPPSNLFIPQAHIKCLQCASMMGLLGELCLQVKGKSRRVPDSTPDQEGPEGEERSSEGTAGPAPISSPGLASQGSGEGRGRISPSWANSRGGERAG